MLELIEDYEQWLFQHRQREGQEQQPQRQQQQLQQEEQDNVGVNLFRDPVVDDGSSSGDDQQYHLIQLQQLLQEQQQQQQLSEQQLLSHHRSLFDEGFIKNGCQPPVGDTDDDYDKPYPRGTAVDDTIGTYSTNYGAAGVALVGAFALIWKLKMQKKAKPSSLRPRSILKKQQSPSAFQ